MAYIKKGLMGDFGRVTGRKPPRPTGDIIERVLRGKQGMHQLPMRPGVGRSIPNLAKLFAGGQPYAGRDRAVFDLDRIPRVPKPGMGEYLGGNFNLGGDVMRMPARPPMGVGRAEAMDAGNAAGALPPGAGDEYGPDAFGGGRGMIGMPYSPPQHPVWPGMGGMGGRPQINPAILDLIREMLAARVRPFSGSIPY